MQKLWSSLVGGVEHQVGDRHVIEERALSKGEDVNFVGVRDLASDELFALKKIACRDEASLNDALREAEMLKRLPPHKNIVGYFGHEIIRPPPYEGSKRKANLFPSYVIILLELCPGGDLMDYITRHKGVISEKKLLKAFTEISEAIFFLHSQSPPLQHRNLRLDSAVRGKDGTWKIADFSGCTSEEYGASELEAKTQPQLMELKDEICKQTDRNYCAPEMVDLSLHLPVSVAVDLWMLGCILFALTFNRLPFKGGVLAIRSGEYILPKRDPEPSSKLMDLVVWLLTVDPQYRPTARALLETLWQWNDLEALQLPESVAERRARLLADRAARAQTRKKPARSSAAAQITESSAGAALPGNFPSPRVPGVAAQAAGTKASTTTAQASTGDSKRIAALEAELAAMKRARDEADMQHRVVVSELTALKKSIAVGQKTDTLTSKIQSEAKMNVSNGSTAASVTPRNCEKSKEADAAQKGSDANLKETCEAIISSPTAKAAKIQELSPLLDNCQNAASDLERTTKDLAKKSGLVNQRAQWQALPDQINALGECFSRSSQALCATRRRLDALTVSLENIEDGITTQESLERLRKIENIHTATLEEMRQIKEAGLLPLTGPSPEACGSDLRVLQAWESRLRWEATFASVEQGAWQLFWQAAEPVIEATEAHLGVGGKAEDSHLNGTVPPSTGKGKPPSAPKGRGRGTAKSKGRGKLIPIQSSHEDLTSPVTRAAQEHSEQSLFGTQTRKPDVQMLSHVKRSFPTFVDRLQEESGQVASIEKAFGGRGRLLIHACVADRRKKRSSSVSSDQLVVEKVKLIEVIKGEPGPFGDKRRIALELRFKRLSPQLSSDLAHVINSLDFDAYACSAKANYFDAATFLPSIEIKLDKEQDEVDTAKIRTSFFKAEEEDALRAVEAAGEVELLHGLEQRLLPMVHITAFVEKIKLVHIHFTYENLAEEALENIQRAKRACDNVLQSRCFLDLLHVTLQIATYVADFGSIELEGQDFSFFRLRLYEDFKIGRSHSFLSVLCAYLMNLRPRKGDKKNQEKDSSKKGQRRRAASRGPSFLENLDAELAEPRDVLGSAKEVHGKLEGGLSMADLEAQVGPLQEMVEFVERQCLDECALFQPVDRRDTDGHLRFKELSAWSSGRQRLQMLLERLQTAHGSLCNALQDLRASEQHLKEFAALRNDEMKNCGYIEIFYSVLQFVDRLKRTSNELRLHPEEHQELRRTLLQAAPLQIVFSVDNLAHAFDLWARKAVAKDGAAQSWSEDLKHEAICILFNLFDTDATGGLDALEMRISLEALGVDLPKEDTVTHYDVVRLFDKDSSGHLEFGEFQILVEGRIKATFQEFLQGDRGNAPRDVIVDADLERVAAQLNRSDVDADLRRKMISFLDNTEQEGTVNESEFQKLILVRPALKNLEEYCFFNRALSDTPKSDSGKRSQRAWLLRGDPGDGGSSSSSSEDRFPEIGADEGE